MRRLFDLVRGIAALIVIGILVVGVPWALIRFVGEPITPILDAVDGQLLSDERRAELALRGGLTVLAWLAWLQITVSLLVEMAAVARGRIAGRAPVLPGVQGLARRLVVTASMTFNAFVSTTATTALVPLAVPPPAVVDVDAAPAPVGDPFLVDASRHVVADHVVEPGETFWSLAESMLGDGVRWREIRDANLGRTMADGTTVSSTTEVVRPGWAIVLPPGAVVPDPGPAPLEVAADPGDDGDPGPVSEWEVEEGEHFWAIAEQNLAAAYGRQPTEAEIRPYWLALIEANQDRITSGDPDVIHPGERFDTAVEPLDWVIDGSGPVDGRRTASATGVEPPIGSGPVERLPAAPAGSPGPGLPTSPGSGQGEASRRPAAETRPDGGTSTDRLDPTDGRFGEALHLPLGLFGTAVGGGALLMGLRARRRRIAATRRPGDLPGPPTGSPRFEGRVRTIASTDAVEWLETTNRLLAGSLAGRPEHHLPAVMAMRAGEFGVELLLDESCAPSSGFVDVGGGGTAWRVDPAADLDRLHESASAVPYSPALVPVGGTESGDLLIDLEQLAVLAVGGRPDLVTRWQTTLVAALGAMPWSTSVDVVAIGLDGAAGFGPRVTVPTDPEGWAEAAASGAPTGYGPAPRSAYHRRVEAGDRADPTVVVVGPGWDRIAERLVEVAELAHSPLTLVAAADLAGHARAEIEDGRAVIVPDHAGLRLEFDPIGTEPTTAAVGASLLAGLGDGVDPVPAITIADTVRRRTRAADPAGGLAPPPPDPVVADPIPDLGASGLGAVWHHRERDASVPGDGGGWPPPTGRPRQEVGEADLGTGGLTVRAPDIPGGVPDLGSAAAPPVAEVRPSRLGGPDGAGPDVAADLDRRRATLVAERPIEVAVLVADPVVTTRPAPGDAPATLDAEAEALVAFVATLGPVTGAQLGGLLWPDLNPTEAAERAVAISAELDERFGTSPLVAAGDGSFDIADHVGSDWRRLVDLADLADRATDRAGELSSLQAALALVGGPPGEGGGAWWSWLGHDERVYVMIEALVVDLAHRLGELALAGGRSDIARWAAHQGQLVVPGHEALRDIEVRAAGPAGEVVGVGRP